MQIFCKSEATKVVSVDDSATVRALKERLQVASGMDADEQVLSFGGKTLQDDEIVFAAGVRDGNTVYVSMRMRGGKEETVSHFDFLDFSNDFELCEQKTIDPSFSEMFWALDTDMEPSQAPHDTEANETEAQCSSDGTPSSPDTDAGEDPAEVGGKRKHCEAEEEEATMMEEAEEAKQPLKAQRKRRQQSRQLPVMMPPVYPSLFHFAPQPQFFAPPPMMQQRRGVAYDLETVDERTKKRLLKNRRSAERSRQRKNEMLKDSSEQLHASQQEAAALRAEQEALRSTNAELQRQNEKFRSLLLAHGILFE